MFRRNKPAKRGWWNEAAELMDRVIGAWLRSHEWHGPCYSRGEMMFCAVAYEMRAMDGRYIYFQINAEWLEKYVAASFLRQADEAGDFFEGVNLHDIALGRETGEEERRLIMRQFGDLNVTNVRALESALVFRRTMLEKYAMDFVSGYTHDFEKFSFGKDVAIGIGIAERVNTLFS